MILGRTCKFVIPLIGVGWILCTSAYAQYSKDKSSQTTINVQFDDKEEEEEGGYLPDVSQLFSSPALASGLRSGAVAINRSIESLMDALFYSMMDNELKYDLTDSAWFSFDLQRDVYDTPAGAYVVVDRVGMGPHTNKELMSVHNIPISLGVDGKIEAITIYLRTDALRIAEQDELPFFEMAVNNWFGLLPLFSRILPPSFNPNEMYDPLRQLRAPFVFPGTISKFYDMPLGAIHSYNVSGGVHLVSDFGGMVGNDTVKALAKMGGMEHSLPYSIFVQGTSRINVFRRGQHKAWVGLSTLKRGGHGGSSIVGNTMYIFTGALAFTSEAYSWSWVGFPAQIFPIDADLEQAISKKFDQLYEYDLTKRSARKAYLDAVKGDFTTSYTAYLMKKEKRKNTGVTFHFTKDQDQVENIFTNRGPNFAVYGKSREQETSESEIEIKDQDGTFFILEAKQGVNDRGWDVLVGDESVKLMGSAEIKVNRDVDPKDKSAYTYSYLEGKNPENVTLSLSIEDKYIDVEEYRKYLSLLRFVTMLPMKDLPEFGKKDPRRLRDRRRSAFFASHDTEITTIHTTPTFLGQFNAQAVIGFSTRQIEKIKSASENEMWKAFALSYNLPVDEWEVQKKRESLLNQLKWFRAFLFYPLRLFNVRLIWADAINDATGAVEALMELKKTKTPAESRAAFYRLFDIDHPKYLMRALMILANTKSVPRVVTFSTKPKGRASPSIKQKFGKLNGRKFSSIGSFPLPSRYERAMKKMGQFDLSQPSELRKQPKIKGIHVDTRTAPKKLRKKIPKKKRKDKHVYVRIEGKGLKQKSRAKIYVRIEQSGAITFGKLELVEKVISQKPIKNKRKTNLENLTYGFFLTGPLSKLRNFVYDQAVKSGDRFRVVLAISRDGTVWSDEKSFEFIFDKGRLAPIDE